MRRISLCLSLVAVALLALSGPALALPAGGEPIEALAGMTPDSPTLAVSSPRMSVSQDAALVVASAPDTVLGLTFEQLVALLASVVVPLFLGIGGWLWKDSAKQKEEKIAAWIRAAYLITEEVAKLTPTKVDDKIAYALKVLSERLEAAGIKPTAAIGEQARATWTAMSGAEKVEAGVRAKAVVLANQKQAEVNEAANSVVP